MYSKDYKFQSTLVTSFEFLNFSNQLLIWEEFQIWTQKYFTFWNLFSKSELVKNYYVIQNRKLDNNSVSLFKQILLVLYLFLIDFLEILFIETCSTLH